MARNIGVQNYPRVEGVLLDDSKLIPHEHTIPIMELYDIIKDAIKYANRKSSRVILDISENLSDEEVHEQYIKAGKNLFSYFKRYCGDPASTAFQCQKRHYSDIAKEQFHNRTLQKERMNSGWRYQALAKNAASQSKRFLSVSDIGTIEADFNATIRYVNSDDTLTIYVSVKNRTNTMGGQDWPKAISALENVAISDKNRGGSYICVFGIAMERGKQLMKNNSKAKTPHSINTEIWKSDYFWPFFTNVSYRNIRAFVVFLKTHPSPHTPLHLV